MKYKKVIMNEYAECIAMLKDGLNGRSVSQSIGLLARYYANELGCSNFEVYNRLTNYLKTHVDAYTERKFKRLVEYYSVNHRGKLISIDHIDVCFSEIEAIQALPNKKLKNLAITLLCVAKFNHQVNPNNDYWCNLSINQLSSIAMVRDKTSKVCDYLHQLYKLGLIKFNRRVSNTNINVLFVDRSNSDVAFKVTNFDTVIKEYNSFLKLKIPSN
jgi:hypothetical protein